MIARILLSALVIAGFSSCATYRTGQTPDDVYYSPAKSNEEYVQVREVEDDRHFYNEDRLDDQRLRQQIRDQRFRNFNDEFYWNNPRWGFNNGWNNMNNGWGWNNWNSNWGWNNYWGWNHGLGWSNPWGWNSPFICIPTSNSMIVIGGPVRTNSTGIRYSSPIKNYNTGNPSTGKGTYSNGSGRYFGGSSNTNSNRRSGTFFGGAGNTNYNNNRSSGAGRFFGSGGSNNSGSSWNSGSSSSGGGRTFSSGGSSSSGGGSKSSSGGATRKN